MTVQPAYDYGAYQTSEMPVGDNLMARLSGLAADQLQAEARVAKLEEELKQAKEHHRHISENQMPELMEQTGMETFTTKEGIEISIKSVIRGSIPKDTQEQAFKWLEENNQGKLIKRNFIIDFGKGDEAWAAKFERDLGLRKKPLNVKRKTAVAPQTLQAFVRTALEEGVPIPMNVFGVYRQNFSKVKVK